MAITRTFASHSIYMPGMYGDRRTGWFHARGRFGMLTLLHRLGVRSADPFMRDSAYRTPWPTSGKTVLK